MQFRLLEFSGYIPAIISVQMSRGKYYSFDKTMKLYDLLGRITDSRGMLIPDADTYRRHNLGTLPSLERGDVYDAYERDKADLLRRLGIVFENAMHKHTHHTLMKYMDLTFVTEGLHRGAQDDLDSHAIAFNNRITRFSTRLAEIPEPVLSEWYQDKVIPFHQAFELLGELPEQILTHNGITFHYTPFGYMSEEFVNKSSTNGLFKDVQRGLIGLGHPGPALWKIDLFNFRYVYSMRGKLTKASPELREGMEQLADQIESQLPVFGPYIRKVWTKDGKWEDMNRAKLVSKEFFTKAVALMQAAGEGPAETEIDAEDGGHLDADQ